MVHSERAWMVRPHSSMRWVAPHPVPRRGNAHLQSALGVLPQELSEGVITHWEHHEGVVAAGGPGAFVVLHAHRLSPHTVLPRHRVHQHKSLSPGLSLLCRHAARFMYMQPFGWIQIRSRRMPYAARRQGQRLAPRVLSASGESSCSR